MTIEVSAYHQKSLVAVLKNTATADQINAYCDQQGDVTCNIEVLDHPLSDASALINGGADVVIVEAEANDSAAADKLEQLCEYCKKSGAFIVIMEDPSADTVRQLFRAGVTDVLPTPVMKNELIAALNTAWKSISPKSAEIGNGKIITVLKTAGGVGATTVAANLARGLCDNSGEEVGLVDLDIQFGTLALSLDLKPRMSIIEAVRAGSRIDAMLLRSVMEKHKSGVNVLSAPNGLLPLDSITDEFITALTDLLKSSFRYSVIELPMGWSDWTRSVFEASSMIIPVFEPSVRCASGASRIMDGFREFSLSSPPLFAVANKVKRLSESKDRLRQIAETMNTQTRGVIREDEKTATDAEDRGKFVKDIGGKSPMAQDFAALSEKVLGRLSPHAAADSNFIAEKRSKPKRFLFLGDS